MRISVMLEPQQGLSYATQRAVARRAERLGFDGLYRSDHYSAGADADLPSTDAWAALAALAADTERLVLGTLVSPVTFRPAGNLAKVVATVAEVAGTRDGAPRVHLGMGTGWMEREHREHGFPFEDVATRFRRLEEQLRVVSGLWDPDAAPFSFSGEFERIDGARFTAKPDPRPRLIVGGKGLRKTPRLAARYADELNTPFASPEECRALRAALRAACEREGRDPATVGFSLMTACLVGGDERDFRRRAERLHRESGAGGTVDGWLNDRAGRWVLGTPGRALERLAELADSGVDAVMLQHQLPDDLDMLDVVAAELTPRL